MRLDIRDTFIIRFDFRKFKFNLLLHGEFRFQSSCRGYMLNKKRKKKVLRRKRERELRIEKGWKTDWQYYDNAKTCSHGQRKKQRKARQVNKPPQLVFWLRNWTWKEREKKKKKTKQNTTTTSKPTYAITNNTTTQPNLKPKKNPLSTKKQKRKLKIFLFTQRREETWTKTLFFFFSFSPSFLLRYPIRQFQNFSLSLSSFFSLSSDRFSGDSSAVSASLSPNTNSLSSLILQFFIVHNITCICVYFKKIYIFKPKKVSVFVLKFFW